MIASLTGQLSNVDDERVLLRAGPIEYELLIPASDAEALRGLKGGEITFHTLYFMQGDGNFFEPTLIGFREARDKRFFEQFITVKGIGPRTALRALTVATSDIAAAVERKDAKFLTGLKGIGKRTAELIIAELSGKLGSFVNAISGAATSVAASSPRSTTDEDALGALVALGESRYNAEQLLDRAKQANPDAKRPDQLIREMLRLRSAR
jgi:holliday junction DNA helicase RuvA